MKRFLLLLTAVLLLCCRLFAVGFNVLVYPHEEHIFSLIKKKASTRTYSESTFSSITAWDYLQQKKDSGEKLNKAYESENESSISKQSTEYKEILKAVPKTEDMSCEIILSESDSMDLDLGAILAGDLLYLDFICSSNCLDMILIPVMERETQTNTLYCYDNANREFFKVYEHEIKDGLDYSSETDDQILNLVTNGNITADSEFTTNKEQESFITIASAQELKPEWMRSSEQYKKAKNGFYYDFARTVIMFGAKVALATFNTGNSGFIDAADKIMTGAITVSVVDMIHSLIGYYRQTEYIAP